MQNRTDELGPELKTLLGGHTLERARFVDALAARALELNVRDVESDA